MCAAAALVISKQVPFTVRRGMRWAAHRSYTHPTNYQLAIAIAIFAQLSINSYISTVKREGKKVEGSKRRKENKARENRIKIKNKNERKKKSMYAKQQKQ